MTEFLPQRIHTTRAAIQSLDPLTRRFVIALVMVGDIKIDELEEDAGVKVQHQAPHLAAGIQ